MEKKERKIIVYDNKNAVRANVLFWVSIMLISGLFIALQEWLSTNFERDFSGESAIIGLLLVTVLPMYIFVLWLESRLFACELRIDAENIKIIHQENEVQIIDNQNVSSSYFKRRNRSFFWYIAFKDNAEIIRIKVHETSYEKQIVELCEAHQIPIQAC